MPNIRTLEAPQGIGLNPTEMGVDAATQAARRIGTFYNQTADLYGQEGNELNSTIRDAGDVVVKYQDHRQISDGSAKGTQMAAGLDDKWNQLLKGGGVDAEGKSIGAADPNDPTVRAKFLEETVKPSLEQFKEGFSTEASQAWADQFTRNLESHLSTKTAADQSTLAGIALQQNVQKTINTLSSTVRNDPSSLDFALKTLDHTIGGIAGSSPTLDAVSSAKVGADVNMAGKKAVVQSFLLGVAEKNPDQAQKIIDSGKYGEFITGTEAKSIIGYARTNQRLAESESRNARVMGDYTAKQDFHRAANDLELSTAPANPGESPTLPKDYWQKVRQIGQMPGATLEPGRLKSMVENGERITTRLGKPEPLAPISHATTIDLLGRMRATDDSRLDTNDEIYKAYGDGKLNTADFNFLNKEFKEMRSPEGDALSKDRQLFFKQYAGAIGGRAYDPVMGSPKLYAAEMDARRIESDLRRKGLDPHLAYDPTSEYFIGNPKRIAKYQGTMQGDLETRATLPGNGFPADKDIVATQRTSEPPIARDAPRTAGETYMTPAGKMKWTGTGWVKP